MKYIDPYASKAIECFQAAMSTPGSAHILSQSAQMFATLSLSLQQKEANSIEKSNLSNMKENYAAEFEAVASLRRESERLIEEMSDLL